MIQSKDEHYSKAISERVRPPSPDPVGAFSLGSAAQSCPVSWEQCPPLLDCAQDRDSCLRKVVRWDSSSTGSKGQWWPGLEVFTERPKEMGPQRQSSTQGLTAHQSHVHQFGFCSPQPAILCQDRKLCALFIMLWKRTRGKKKFSKTETLHFFFRPGHGCFCRTTTSPGQAVKEMGPMSSLTPSLRR